MRKGHAWKVSAIYLRAMDVHDPLAHARLSVPQDWPAAHKVRQHMLNTRSSVQDYAPFGDITSLGHDDELPVQNSA